MKVKKLRDLLEQYPDDTQVYVIREREPYGFGLGTLMDIELNVMFDQDTNKGSVCLSPKPREEI